MTIKQKKNIKQIILMMLLHMLIIWTPCALAEETEVLQLPLMAVIPAQGGTAEVYATQIDDETFLFLPSFAKMEETELRMNGEAVQWTECGETEDGDLLIEVESEEEETLALRVMQGDRLRSLFLFSDDPVNEGREYIDHCDRHENYTSATMALVDAEGRVNHAGKIEKLRGRGNGTWSDEKKPYQFKLKEKQDLLDTGIAEEANRTWVLLAEYVDCTSLHAQITFDLGFELGMEQSSHCEHVDLFYDGEYRGMYLLAEKPEIGEGRIEETDYDRLIKDWNRKVGQRNLDELPAKEAQNRFGNTYSYVDGLIESSLPDAGAYMLEMESLTTLSDRSYFYLSDGSLLGCKNPDNASQKMMEYISTRLQEAQDTIMHGGINPENGRTIFEDFDVDAFARTFLIQELSCNGDGYVYSSSWFVLPAGKSQFIPGPLWDFDWAWGEDHNGGNKGGVGLKGSRWMRAFYKCDAFLEYFRKLYSEEFYPIIQDVLLGNKKGKYLRSFEAYTKEIYASKRMNDTRWRYRPVKIRYGRDAIEAWELMRKYIDERSRWLYDIFRYNTDERIYLYSSAKYLRVEETTGISIMPWVPVKVRIEKIEQLTEATEEEYALWRLDGVIEPNAGEHLGTPELYFNGTPIEYEIMEDGTFVFSVYFRDFSYRPVDYYGEDVGLVYNEDYYVQNHPEVLEVCENDSQALLDYFFDEGIYMGHKGNGFFYAKDALQDNPHLYDVLGEEWSMYYWDFISYGHFENWLQYNNYCFLLEPEVYTEE